MRSRRNLQALVDQFLRLLLSNRFLAAHVPCIVTLPENHKFASASPVYPDSVLIVSPRRALHTRRGACLTHQLYGGSLHVRIAVVPPTIVRRAAHPQFFRLGGLILDRRVLGCRGRFRSWLCFAQFELSRASFINPDSFLVPAPGLSLDTLGGTGLLQKMGAVARVRLAVVFVAIVRRTGDGLSSKGNCEEQRKQKKKSIEDNRFLRE